MHDKQQIQELQNRLSLYSDESAYKELYLLFYRCLRQFAYSFLKSKEQAEEVVSDVFLKIWENRRQLEAIQNLKVYLYVSIKNTAIKYLQKKNRQQAISIDELEVEPESFTYNPEQLMLTAEMMNRIRQAVHDLPPRCRIIFKLIREDGLKYREVAEILNISIKTIDNQLAIALSKISKSVALDLEKFARNN